MRVSSSLAVIGTAIEEEIEHDPIMVNELSIPKLFLMK
jgi:hypothetical protein